MNSKKATYSSKTDRHAAHKHLFGSSDGSDFIINMTAEGAQKLSGRYAVAALITIAVSSLPYYISKAVESGDVYNLLTTKNNSTLAFLIMTLLIAAGFLGILVFMISCVKKEIRVGKNPALLLLPAILLIALISALCSSDIGTAFFGYLDRAEGIITIIGYLGFFAIGMALTSDKYRKRAADTVVVIGSVNGILGILQSIPALSKWIPSYYNYLFIDYIMNLGKADYFSPYAGYEASYAADGLCCSPFALGALLTAACAFAANGAVRAKKTLSRLLYIAAAGIMSAAAILTQTLPAMLGVGTVLVLTFAFSFASGKANGKDNGKTADNSDDNDDSQDKPLTTAKRAGSAVLMLVIAGAIFAGVFATGNFRFRNERIMYTDAFERLQITYGAHTPHEDGIFPTLWYEGSLVFENNPLLGVGPDNWGDMYNMGEGMEIDRSYNEYLDIAITRGVIAALLHILLLAVTLIKAIRILRSRMDDPVMLGAFIGFAAYCVQAFFNISTASSTPYFYLIIGMIWSYEALGKLVQKASDKKK